MTLLAGGLGFMLGRHAFVPNGASVQATVGYVMTPTLLSVQATILPTPALASPSPPVEKLPVPTVTAPIRAVSLFEQIVNLYYQSGIEQGDKEKLELSLTLLAETKTFDPEDEKSGIIFGGQQPMPLTRCKALCIFKTKIWDAFCFPMSKGKRWYSLSI